MRNTLIFIVYIYFFLSLATIFKIYYFLKTLLEFSYFSYETLLFSN